MCFGNGFYTVKWAPSGWRVTGQVCEAFKKSLASLKASSDLNVLKQQDAKPVRIQWWTGSLRLHVTQNLIIWGLELELSSFLSATRCRFASCSKKNKQTRKPLLLTVVRCERDCLRPSIGHILGLVLLATQNQTSNIQKKNGGIAGSVKWYKKVLR